MKQRHNLRHALTVSTLFSAIPEKCYIHLPADSGELIDIVSKSIIIIIIVMY